MRVFNRVGCRRRDNRPWDRVWAEQFRFGRLPGMMTWPEVKAAMAAGKTTALVYNGGTEQRGPQRT